MPLYKIKTSLICSEDDIFMYESRIRIGQGLMPDEVLAIIHDWKVLKNTLNEGYVMRFPIQNKLQ